MLAQENDALRERTDHDRTLWAEHYVGEAETTSAASE
jgi:hypothetical protein